MAFVYPEIRAPYVGSLADTMLRQGDIAARGAEQLGAIQAQQAQQTGSAWAGAAQNIGNAFAAVPGHIEAQRHQQLVDANLKSETVQRNQQIQTAQRLDQTKQRIGALISDPSILNEDGTINVKGIIGKMSSLPDGAAGPVEPPDVGAIASIVDPINDHILKARASKKQWEDDKTNALARIASTAYTLGTPKSPEEQPSYLEHAHVGIAAALKSGLITQDDANRFLVPMVEHPEATPKMLQAIAATNTLAPIKVGKEDRLVNPLNPQQTLLDAVSTPKTEAELAADASNPQSRTAAQSKMAFDMITAAKNHPTFELKPGRVDGKLVPAMLDPRTGRLSYNGEDVTERWQPPRDPVEAQAAAIAAQVAQQARAQAFTTQQAGRKELTDKYEAPYLDAREKAATIKRFVAAADTNKVAASTLPLLATLGITTSEGVKRINQVEVDQIAGAGSLLDKIKGKVGKIVEGQPLPKDIRDDIAQLGDLLEKGARDKYEEGFRAVKKRYGLNDEVMKPPPGSPAEGTKRTVNGQTRVWGYYNDQWGWKLE